MSKDLHLETQEEQLAKEPTVITLKLVEEEYKFLGWDNSWNRPQPELRPCKEAKHERRYFFQGRRGLNNTVVCDICKYYYKSDSSD
jgi:hypothetical protein